MPSRVTLQNCPESPLSMNSYPGGLAEIVKAADALSNPAAEESDP